LENYLDLNELKNDKIIFEELLIKFTVPKFQQLNYKTQITLMEESYLLKGKTKNPIVQKILNHMGQNIFTLSDDRVVHIMYNDQYTGSSYNVTAKNIQANGRLRILDGEHWRFVEPKDDEKLIIQGIKQAMKDDVIKRDIPIYGTFSMKDKKFRIVRDGRKGMVCSSMKIPDMHEILYELDVFPPAKYPIENRNVMVEKILNGTKAKSIFTDVNYLLKQSDDVLARIRDLTKWSMKDYCEFLQNYFKQNDIYFEK
jgi:hypothetical protein